MRKKNENWKLLILMTLPIFRILEINGKCVTEDCAEEVRSEMLANLKADDLIEIIVARELEPNHVFQAKRLREELTVVVDALQVSKFFFPECTKGQY